MTPRMSGRALVDQYRATSGVAQGLNFQFRPTRNMSSCWRVTTVAPAATVTWGSKKLWVVKPACSHSALKVMSPKEPRKAAHSAPRPAIAGEGEPRITVLALGVELDLAAEMGGQPLQLLDLGRARDGGAPQDRQGRSGHGRRGHTFYCLVRR